MAHYRQQSLSSEAVISEQTEFPETQVKLAGNR